MFNVKDALILYRGQIPEAETNLYTVPANHVVIITSIHVTNPNATLSTSVKLWVNTAANNNIILKIDNIRKKRGWRQARQITLNAGDVIKGYSTNGVCTCIIDGVLIEPT